MMRTLRMLATAVLSPALLASILAPAPARAQAPAASAPGRPGPVPRGSAERKPELLDELDEARIQRDLLEIEVEADRQQLQKMIAVLKETDLQQIQGFAQGPVIAGTDREDRDSRIAQYLGRLSDTRRAFVAKGKQLGRQRRRVADLEVRLGLNTTVAAPLPGPLAATGQGRWQEAEQVLNLILKGVETWHRGTDPNPAPDRRNTPGDPATQDVDRLLDLVRRGLESWRRDSAPAPAPEDHTQPQPTPAPEERGLQDADRLLDLIRRGLESWQSR
jgi:hypothetical protein